MNYYLSFLLAILAFSCTSVERCGFDEYHKMRLKDSTYAKVVRGHEELLQNVLSRGIEKKEALTYIPVVVHVVYNDALENITDAQILSQINVLNEDYRKFSGTPGANDSLLSADTYIEFRLAQVDPKGNKTIGINRIKSNTAIFHSATNDVKSKKTGGADPWDAKYYLNIWVCPKIVNSKNTNLLGYASFPGETKANDGVVIAYKFFGDKVGTSTIPPYNMGRTTTHEIGHWLNLYHTFKGGCMNTNCLNQGDLVCDTPPVSSESKGCDKKRVSCGVKTLTNDYMDYSNDSCMNIFTNGQNDRMQITIDYIRDTIRQSPALTDNYFYVFGKHEGDYEYVLDNSFVIGQHTTSADKFEISPGSQVKLNTRDKHKVIFRPGVAVQKGAVLVVSFGT